MTTPLEIMRLRSIISRVYAPQNNQFGKVRDSGTQSHQGWDLQASVGTPVRAIADGKLTYEDKGKLGKQLYLEFTHNGFTLYALYAHLSQISVIPPCSVSEGTIIGLVGKTGNAKDLPTNEVHLHFEIRFTKNLGLGLSGRMDPGEILGYHHLFSPK
ncbi:MAG: M23 family metallopeptidase [Spirosomataceae bacterium]